MSEPQDGQSAGTTTPRQVRIAKGHWEAYKRVCDARGIKRAEDLNAYIRQTIAEHGDEQAQRLAAAADDELVERRARMSPGRPPKHES
ncbi:hypothetical protein [Nonomuraea sediminis]|uniref:hypothetical protein n=1 Tax=Nonomuraea sediminis TaxID=2835864 RepID=UPI001BDBF407|nr:hypothetical protein [Nonomuraea sediminis]